MKTGFKVNNFDLLRILAALQVLLGHSVARLDLAHPALWPFVLAFPGVPIFFTISGYLISASYERNTSLRVYVTNRILRIFPGLWCVIFVTIPVAAAFGFSFLHASALAWLLCQMAGFIFTPGFLKTFGFGSYNGSLWTIPIELQFYFLLPIFYIGRTLTERRRTQIFIVALVVFMVAAFIYVLRSAPLSEDVVEPLKEKLLRYSFIPHFYMFLTGVLLQRLNSHRSRWIAGKGPLWVAAYLAAYFSLPHSAIIDVLSLQILAVATVSLAYTAPRLSESLFRGNDISYGVYIYHGLILNVFVQTGLREKWLYVLPVVGLTLAAASLSWRFVERPFLRQKQGTIHAVQAAAPESSSELSIGGSVSTV